VIALLLAVELAAGAPPAADPRTLEILREECASGISRREVVFFANGTIRLREGAPGELRTTLGELGRPDADAVRRRLAEIVLADLEVVTSGPDGDWVEGCRLTLLGEDGERRRIVYGRLDAGSLELEKLRRIVGELATVARDDGGSIEIPAGYRARRGDRLERADGAVFEVLGWTSDGKAVELQSDAPPLTLFVEATQIRVEFRRLLSRRDDP